MPAKLGHTYISEPVPQQIFACGLERVCAIQRPVEHLEPAPLGPAGLRRACVHQHERVRHSRMRHLHTNVHTLRVITERLSIRLPFV